MTFTNTGNNAVREDGRVVWVEQARLARSNPDYERAVKHDVPMEDYVERCNPIGLFREFYFFQCVQCGRDVVAYHPSARYCSERCSNDAYIERRRRRNSAARQKVCVACDTPFTATRRDAKACSPACKQKAYRERGRA